MSVSMCVCAYGCVCVDSSVMGLKGEKVLKQQHQKFNRSL